MHVIKRNGTSENVKYDKILNRIKKQTYGLNSEFLDFYDIAQQVIAGMKDGMTTQEIDQYAAETAALMTTVHPDYSILASRIAITALHKDTPGTFFECLETLYDNGEGQISDEIMEIAKKNKAKLNSAIIKDRDFDIDYFGFRTLERSYLLKLKGRVVETPQHMWMRVSLGIHKTDIKSAIETYDMMSQGYYTHASPTLFNAATKRSQLSSCFLIAMKDDSIEGIFDTIKDVAHISKWSGGIGLHMHNVRSNGAAIRGTGGESSGIISWIKILNETARGVNQGGKRKGAFAIYLEPWHADVFEFLDLKKNHGKEEMRARDLFYALWISDLFMERVEQDADWTLMDPNECPGLADVYGEKFNELYTKYEKEGRGKTIKARSLWNKILDSQIETGTPYMLYKDAANEKSNQKNLGTIKSSNLCTEIMEYSDGNETAVCNLASIALPKYIDIPSGRKWSKDRSKRHFDFSKLKDAAYALTVNLNKVIDINFYPIESTEASNLKHRPIGLGVQGLADTFAMLGYAFESPEAKMLNKQIFETIYMGALEASCDLAKKNGAYKSYKGSPISKGILQWHMWGLTEDDLMHNWKPLLKKIEKHGVRNSLLVAPMPTASTAQILGNNECFEPFTTNIYNRRVLSGEFSVINKHLVDDLIALNLWDEEMKNMIIHNNGSVQDIDLIPNPIKELYKTVWEMKMKNIIEMSADRGAFIDQSQSLNLFMDPVNYAKLTSAHFYAWKAGLKTGMYYLRTKPSVNAIKTLGIEKVDAEVIMDEVACSIDNPDDCVACSA